jgi:hypothetical protein
MKIIRDYEKYIEDDNVGRRDSKKNSFRKMKKESFYDSEKQSDRKNRDKKK